jgi:uncharacterized protein YjiS (DUF1127 family)
MSHIIDRHIPCNPTRTSDLPDGLGRLFLASVQTLQLWYERARQRRCLAKLDERLLRDIGIDRITAMEEVSKPFWRC